MPTPLAKKFSIADFRLAQKSGRKTAMLTARPLIWLPSMDTASATSSR